MTSQQKSTQMTNLKPVTQWVGGKRQLLPQLQKFMPNKYNTYFEPFFGGGGVAVFFATTACRNKRC